MDSASVKREEGREEGRDEGREEGREQSDGQGATMPPLAPPPEGYTTRSLAGFAHAMVEAQRRSLSSALTLDTLRHPPLLTRAEEGEPHPPPIATHWDGAWVADAVSLYLSQPAPSAAAQRR